jgi:hypothetical protein
MTLTALETFRPQLLRRASDQEFVQALSSVRAALLERPAPAPEAVPRDANALIEAAAAWLRSEEPSAAPALGVLVLAAARAELDYLFSPPTRSVPDLEARFEKLRLAAAPLAELARTLVRRREVRRSDVPQPKRQRGDDWCWYVVDLATFLLELEHPDVDRHMVQAVARQARELLGVRQASPGAVAPKVLRDRALDALREALDEARLSKPSSGVFEVQPNVALAVAL